MSILDTIIHRANNEETIRAIILTGSRAGKGPVDELSDFDLAIFTRDAKKYTNDNSWLDQTAQVLVCVEDQKNNDFGSIDAIPTRLVIFKDGTKVDFAFYPIAALEKPIPKLPIAYNSGYTVLLDKDDITKALPAPIFTIQVTEKPSSKEFDRVVREFFFEVYHVAKYLQRNDLWHAKFRDWAAKEFLLKMIEWHELATHNWSYDVHYLGKRMEFWVNSTTWKDLHKTFGHFDAADGWIALEATIELFRNLAIYTSKLLEYEYPIEVDRDMTTLHKKMCLNAVLLQ